MQLNKLESEEFWFFFCFGCSACNKFLLLLFSSCTFILTYFVPVCRHFVDGDMGVEFIDAVQHGPRLVGQRYL